MLPCNKSPVARRLNITEVDETAAWHFRRVDYTPAFIGGESLDYSYLVSLGSVAWRPVWT